MTARKTLLTANSTFCKAYFLQLQKERWHSVPNNNKKNWHIRIQQARNWMEEWVGERKRKRWKI